MPEIRYIEQIDPHERQPARFRLEVYHLPVCYSTAAPFGDQDEMMAVPLGVKLLHITESSPTASAR
jgi:hypothetical protein